MAAGALLGLIGCGGSALAAKPKAKHRATTRAARHHQGGGGPGAGGFNVSSVNWGQPGVNLYTLSNANGMQVKISNYGGVVQSIWVPNRQGNLTNVALGFPTLSDYVNDFTQGANNTSWPESGGSGDTYFGAIIGRYANRIGAASFDLNGQHYTLDANNNGQTLHGGYLGWNTAVWSASTSTSSNGYSVSLTLTKTFPAKEGCLPARSGNCTGFPAPVTATVVYSLTRDNQLQIHYNVVNDSSSDATVVNVTNHTYFNLGGEGNRTIYNELLALDSDQYTPVDVNLIPQKPYFADVTGTPYDFRWLHPIGQMIRDTNLPDHSDTAANNGLKQLQIAHGYDNNWVLNGQGTYRLVAVAEDPRSGVTLDAYTDQPGVQVYTGNFLVGDLIGTSGRVYRQGDAFTLETQHYPDSPHHIGDPAWPSVVLNPNATFNSTTSFQFGTNGQRSWHRGRKRFR